LQIRLVFQRLLWPRLEPVPHLPVQCRSPRRETMSVCRQIDGDNQSRQVRHNVFYRRKTYDS
jgi:hypothetical protein